MKLVMRKTELNTQTRIENIAVAVGLEIFLNYCYKGCTLNCYIEFKHNDMRHHGTLHSLHNKNFFLRKHRQHKSSMNSSCIYCLNLRAFL